jgi:hypothetical protein
LSRTFTILRRASSIAFCTATGTSFALPLPIPTRPSPSPDHGQRCEAENASALHHFGDTVDADHLFAQAVAALVLLLLPLLHSRHGELSLICCALR